MAKGQCCIKDQRVIFEKNAVWIKRKDKAKLFCCNLIIVARHRKANYGRRISYFQNLQKCYKLGWYTFLQQKLSMQVPTGKVVAIQGRVSKRYLDGRDVTGRDVLMTNRNPHGDHFLNWKIRQLTCGIFVVESVSSKCFLDGRAQSGSNALVTNRHPDNDAFLQWRIFYTGEEDWFVFESVSSRCFLDGRGGQDNALVTNRNWRNDHFFYFRFINV